MSPSGSWTARRRRWPPTSSSSTTTATTPTCARRSPAALLQPGRHPRAAGPPARGAGRLPAAHRRLPRRPQPRPARAGRQRRCYNRGVTLGQLDRPHEALAAYQQLIDDYRDDPSLREQVATALLNRGATLGQLDRPHEALAAYQQLIDDYRDDPDLREQVELATVALYELGGTGGPH